eukprot:646536-Prymnesium_polylepis.1
MIALASPERKLHRVADRAALHWMRLWSGYKFTTTSAKICGSCVTLSALAKIMHDINRMLGGSVSKICAGSSEA